MCLSPDDQLQLKVSFAVEILKENRPAKLIYMFDKEIMAFINMMDESYPMWLKLLVHYWKVVRTQWKEQGKLQQNKGKEEFEPKNRPGIDPVLRRIENANRVGDGEDWEYG